MPTLKLEHFYRKSHNKKKVFPLDVQFELTYRCNLNCIHCYCQGLKDYGELSFREVKKILTNLRDEGFLWLAFTGGEPLVRKDFWDIYLYAKKLGFLVIIFSNAQLFDTTAINYLRKYPVAYIEITLNGITPDTYERITQKKNSFERVIHNIKLLAKNKIPVLIKANLLKQNKEEIFKIKKWTEDILGRPQKGYYFKYDPLIYPRLNADKTPCNYRLSPEQIVKVLRQDKDMWREYLKELHKGFPNLSRDKDYLYQCNSWKSQVFINPQGRVKFCLFSDKFSFDLKETPFKPGYKKMCSEILSQKFKSNSSCRNCRLRPICAWCPAKAYLETGSEEKPVKYYCHFNEVLWDEKR